MTRSKISRSLVATGVLLWLIAVVPAYYVFHKPFDAAHSLRSPS
jgi:hypothetical protein